jgi:hypothetical protein
LLFRKKKKSRRPRWSLRPSGPAAPLRDRPGPTVPPAYLPAPSPPHQASPSSSSWARTPYVRYSHGSHTSSSLFRTFKAIKRLTINTKVIPIFVENPFRELIFHLVHLISQTVQVHRMPPVGIHIPISLLSPSQYEQTGAPCVPSSSIFCVLTLSSNKPCTDHTGQVNLTHKLEFIAGFRRPP